MDEQQRSRVPEAEPVPLFSDDLPCVPAVAYGEPRGWRVLSQSMAREQTLDKSGSRSRYCEEDWSLSSGAPTDQLIQAPLEESTGGIH